LPFGIRYSAGSIVLVFRHDADAALVLVVAAELHTPRNLGDDGVILGTAGLEQLRHARQTTGDVAGLGAFQRDTGQSTSPEVTDEPGSTDRIASTDRR
jgi:hypothetical protein